jgi:hypothetical protein
MPPRETMKKSEILAQLRAQAAGIKQNNRLNPG